MRAVLLEVPEHLLAERRRLGHDHRDEMWEGELHMVPPAGERHQRRSTGLVIVFAPHLARRGLRAAVEIGVFDPAIPEMTSFRVPDLSVYRPGVASERGIEGAASLAVEIRSPGDETFDKLPFYDRVGVAEVLVIDRDSAEVRRWHRHAGGLVEAPAGDDGWHRLDAVPVAVAGDAGVLRWRNDEGGSGEL